VAIVGEKKIEFFGNYVLKYKELTTTYFTSKIFFTK
jgi:hypothetical protein